MSSEPPKTFYQFNISKKLEHSSNYETSDYKPIFKHFKLLPQFCANSLKTSSLKSLQSLNLTSKYTKSLQLSDINFNKLSSQSINILSFLTNLHFFNISVDILRTFSSYFFGRHSSKLGKRTEYLCFLSVAEQEFLKQRN